MPLKDSTVNKKSKPVPRATAKQIFDEVGARLQVDPGLLSYLYGECFAGLINEAEKTGSCTMRGLGRLKKTTVFELVHNYKDLADDLMIFEKTKHNPKNTPFAAWSLKKRITANGGTQS
jgi:hypothetical protein